jgi:hypothetical protein
MHLSNAGDAASKSLAFSALLDLDNDCVPMEVLFSTLLRAGIALDAVSS